MEKTGAFILLIAIFVALISGIFVTLNLTGFAVYESTGFNFSFVNPTPANATITTNTSIEINSTLENATEINDFIFNWNNTNFSFYSSNLIFMSGFNGNENNTKEIGKGPHDSGLTSELLGLWHLNDNNLSDASGNGNDGTAQGGLSCAGNQGVFEEGCEFDGNDDYISTGKQFDFSSSDSFSVSGWVNRKGANVNGNGGAVASKVRAGPNSWELGFLDGGAAVFEVNGDNTLRERAQSSQYSLNEWTYFTGVYNGSDNSIKLYINGELAGTDTYTDTGDFDRADDMEIGRRATDTFRSLNGNIDEVAIWNRTLSNSEILDLYERGIAKDHSIYNNSAVTLDEIILANGKHGNGYLLDGISDYMEIPDSSSLDITQNITLEAWVNVQEKSSDEMGIMTKAEDSSAIGYNLIYDAAGANEGFRFELNDTSPSPPLPAVYSTTTANLDTWYYVVGTYDQSEMCIYVNGVKENCEAQSFTQATNNHKIYIGNHIGFYFNGTIDEPRIWNRSFSEDEISQMYLSNLRKYDSGGWNFYANQSKNITAELNDGTYTYKTLSSDTDGDFAESETRHITIGSPVALNHPVNDNNSVDLSKEIDFTCTITDNLGVNNVSLYSDYNGSWELIETKNISGLQNETTFNRSILSDLGDETQFLDDGITWNCRAHGDDSGFNFADSNFTFSSWDFGNYTELSKTTKTDGENLTLEDNDTLQELPNNNESNFFFNMSGKSPFALYHLNNNSNFGESDTLMYDFSGSGNNGTCSGSNCPNFTSSGLLNGAFDFNEDLDYISVVNDAEADTLGNDFSISLWFKSESTSGHSSGRLISRDCSDFWCIFIDQSSGYYQSVGIWYNDTHGTTVNYVARENTWHHVAAVWDGSNVNLYFDGSLKDTVVQGNFASSDRPIILGDNTEASPNPTGSPFYGKMDEVAIFDSVLSSNDIKSIYDSQKGKYLAEGEYRSQIFDSSSLADFNNFSWSKYFPYGKELPNNQEIETGYLTGNVNMTGNKVLYHFNNNASAGESTTVAYDFSGNGRNASIFNGTSVNVDGRFGKGVHFDGTDDQIHVDGDIGMTNSPMTLSLWINADSKDTGYVADNRDPGNWWFIKDYTGTGICQDDNGDLCFDNRLMANESDWRAGEWTHILITDDTSTAKMYINGRIVDTGVGEGNNITTNLRFGARFSNSNYFEGKMDEIALWNRTLSESEISDVYNRGALRLDLQTRTSNDGTNFKKHELPDNQSDELWADMTGNSLLFHFNKNNSYREIGSHGDENLTESSSGLWHLNNNNLSDASGNGNDGTAKGGIDCTNDIGIFDEGCEFDGNDDGINASQPDSLNLTTSFSVVVWVNPDVDCSSNRMELVSGVSKWAMRCEDRSDSGFISPGNSFSPGLQFQVLSSSDDLWYNANSTISQSQWTHSVGVHNGTHVKIYINGELKRSVAINSGASSGNGNFFLGRNSAGNYFDGNIDEVAIWNRTLSDSEILDLYERGRINESSGNNNGGTIAGAVFNSSGYINGSFEFDGVNDYVEVSDNPDLDSNIRDTLSISAWINLKKVSGISQGIVSKYNHSSGSNLDDSYYLGVASTGGIRFQYNPGNAFIIKQSSDKVNDSQWHHVAGVYDGVKGKIYIDGAEAPLSIEYSDTGGDLNDVNHGVKIGNTMNQGDLISFFNGSIDEVAIWNRTLSETEIKYIYDAQKDGYLVQENPAGTINSSTQYFQYKTNFYSDNTSETPYLQFVKLNYTDLVAPIVQFVSSTTSSGTHTNQNFIEANITAIDDAGIDSITMNLYKDGSLIRTSSSSSSPFFHNFTGLSNGDYSLNATAIDNDGNNASTETREISIEVPVSTSETSSDEGTGGGVSGEIQCVVKSDCPVDEYCLDNQCVKLFDVTVEEFESPAAIGDFFDFTYFIKGMADFNGDVIIDFWIEDSSRNKVSSGSDTIFLGSFEEKTETTKIFLPSDAVSGRYTFYVEVSYDNYSAQAHRTIEISVKEDGTAEITPISGLNITPVDLVFYLLIGILIVAIIIVALLISWTIKSRSGKNAQGITERTKK